MLGSSRSEDGYKTEKMITRYQKYILEVRTEVHKTMLSTEKQILKT